MAEKSCQVTKCFFLPHRREQTEPEVNGYDVQTLGTLAHSTKGLIPHMGRGCGCGLEAGKIRKKIPTAAKHITFLEPSQAHLMDYLLQISLSNAVGEISCRFRLYAIRTSQVNEPLEPHYPFLQM